MKRTYSKEFKIKACELVIKENIAVAVVAEKFGIHHVMLHRWVSEYRELGEDAFVGKGHQNPADAELRRLRKENERLKMENEILKKQRHTLQKTRRTDKVCPKRADRM